mmetsp:Transcript_27801/g.70026  ORF Transcript_27801/g.70026 Transcript_27801/m.70026 type:complete len:344 (-) Transcript_27801:209-1240(-)
MRNHHLLYASSLVMLVVGAGGVDHACDRATQPCVDAGDARTYDNTQVYRTAVGCVKSLSVVFSGPNSTSPTVHMCERQPSGACVPRPGALLTPFQRRCCEVPFQERHAECSAAPDQGLPMDTFQCMQLTQSAENGGRTNATLSFMAPFQSDLQNAGQVEVCLVASHGSAAQSGPFCVVFQVERCSVCLQEGEGLSVLARKYGTHWTQLYTSNPEITGNPDNVDEGQLVRLGMIYRVKERDTAMSIALKFGVSINQIFFWNRHLVAMPETGDGMDSTGLSRDLPTGLELCVLPKTCLTSFGDNQPLNFLQESSPAGEGGWWSDAPMVSADEFEVGIPEGGIPQW